VVRNALQVRSKAANERESARGRRNAGTAVAMAATASTTIRMIKIGSRDYLNASGVPISLISGSREEP